MRVCIVVCILVSLYESAQSRPVENLEHDLHVLEGDIKDLEEDLPECDVLNVDNVNQLFPETDDARFSKWLQEKCGFGADWDSKSQAEGGKSRKGAADMLQNIKDGEMTLRPATEEDRDKAKSDVVPKLVRVTSVMRVVVRHCEYDDNKLALMNTARLEVLKGKYKWAGIGPRSGILSEKIDFRKPLSEELQRAAEEELSLTLEQYKVIQEPTDATFDESELRGRFFSPTFDYTKSTLLTVYEFSDAIIQLKNVEDKCAQFDDGSWDLTFFTKEPKKTNIWAWMRDDEAKYQVALRLNNMDTNNEVVRQAQKFPDVLEEKKIPEPLKSKLWALQKDELDEWLEEELVDSRKINAELDSFLEPHLKTLSEILGLDK